VLEIPLFAAFAVVLSYLLGCLNAGYYYVRLVHGQDIRLAGSGTAGARNAGRLFGKGVFAAVFLVDATKGAAATAVGLSIGPEVGALCSIAVVVGHIWPVQLGFRGGKGIASALGALLLLAPWLLAWMALAFTALRAIGQSSSRAGIAAFWVAAAGSALLYGRAQVGAMIALALLITISHRSQLREVPRHD
jgi:acyl phosphate:glycerol-3-phosphate acyltransferase